MKHNSGHFRGLGDQSLSSHHRGPVQIPDQLLWDLWCTKWRWDRFFSQYFSFSLSLRIIPPLLHTHLHTQVALITWTNGRRLGAFQKAMLFRKSGRSS